jgi:hypothetical protein
MVDRDRTYRTTRLGRFNRHTPRDIGSGPRADKALQTRPRDERVTVDSSRVRIIKVVASL